MILGIANDLNSATVCEYVIALRDVLASVIGALRLHVRTNLANQRPHIGLVKDHDRVNVGECRNNLRSLLLGHERTPFAFDLAHAGIGIHRDNQFPAERLRPAQIANVPDVQQIEAAIGQHNLLTGASPVFYLLAQGIARINFGTLVLAVVVAK